MSDKSPNFERTLPEGYSEILVIDAKDKKFAIGLNIAALIITVAVMVPAFCLLRDQLSLEDYSFTKAMVFIIAMFAYIVLHELVHGIAYKALTGEKLTFGMTLTVAYCGVPNIFVYRKTALIALLAPFTVFTVLFGALCFLIPDPFLKFYTAILLGIHLGGCSGDLYDTFVYLTRLRDPMILMQDTGPKQTFYGKK